MRRMTAALSAGALLLGAVGSGTALAKHNPGHGHKHGTPGVSLYASGFSNPRGLTFGPGRNLYVAEGGLGGTHSSAGDPCPQAHGAAAPYFGSSNDPVLGGRISKVDSHGTVSTVVSGPALEPDLARARRLVSGVSAVAATHPAANPDDGDFEPDGTWYSMTSLGRALYPMDSNHGELARVTPGGKVSRVLDISSKLGHVVPTAIVPIGSGHGKGYGTVPSSGPKTPRFAMQNAG